MTRPRYETAGDLGKEREVADVLERAWNCRAAKLPVAYQIDFALIRGGAVVCWAEVKCREKRYSTYMISVRKVLAGLELERVTGGVFLLAVRYSDSGNIYWCRVTESMARAPRLGGRQDRDDWQDMEAVVHIPMGKFKVLTCL